MSQSKWLQTAVQYGGLLLVLLLLVVIFSIGSNNFLQPSTLVTIANQIPDLTFLAVGMTLVLIVRGIDLSVGSLLALSSAVLAVLMTQHDWSLGTSLCAAILVAGLCGTINGVISVGFGIPSFIVTLGMLEIARGATKVVTDSQSVYIGSRIEWFGQPINGLHLSPAFFCRCCGGGHRSIRADPDRIRSLLCGDWHQRRSRPDGWHSIGPLRYRRLWHQRVDVRIGGPRTNVTSFNR